jgi:hypothetical protein
MQYYDEDGNSSTTNPIRVITQIGPKVKKK